MHERYSRRRLPVRRGALPACGTTISMTAEVFPGLRGIAGGTFDERSWIKVDRQVWTRSARSWVTLPSDIEAFPKSSVPPLPHQ